MLIIFFIFVVSIQNEKIMRNLIYLLSTLIFMASCSAYDPEGVWQDDESERRKIVIIKNEENISVRFPGSRRWATLKKVNRNGYMSKATQSELKFIDEGKMEYIDFRNGRTKHFSRIILEKADASVINKQMTREQVLKFIGEPQEKFTENLAEKWLYENGLLLFFDDQGIFKVNQNYKKERDFSKIEHGMTRQQVAEVLGKADREGKWTRDLMGIQKWYYGDNSVIIFNNEGVVNIIPDVEKKRKDFEIASTPIEQTFSILETKSIASPATFEIKGKHKENLECTCSINQDGTEIKLTGAESTMRLSMKGERTFTARQSYGLIETDIGASVGPANQVILQLSTDRFEKGTKLDGHLIFNDNCSTKMAGDDYPCSFKGSFSCVFK